MSLPICALMDSPWTFLYTAGVVLGPMILSHYLRASLPVDVLEQTLCMEPLHGARGMR